jgi:hypothetical protein
VNIAANTAPTGQTFDKWTGDVSGVADVNNASTTYTMGSANATVTATYKALPPNPSSDATLSSLTVSQGTLTPSFNASTTTYSVDVASSVSTLTISATANHGAASVSGTGTKPLDIGANTFHIVVTAEDGTTTKAYTITVNRDIDTAVETVESSFNAWSSNGLLIVESKGSPVKSVSVISISGQILKRIETVSERIEISNLPSQQVLAVIVVMSDGKTKTIKIVMQ